MDDEEVKAKFKAAMISGDTEQAEHFRREARHRRIRGLYRGVPIQFGAARTDKVREFKSEIDWILHCLELDGSLATDESTLGHFLSSPLLVPEQERETELFELQVKLGFRVHQTDLLWQVAEQLRQRCLSGT